MKIKENKAITLIALVITIIVLLILAGVSIALLTGENGILTKAQTASEETKRQGAFEKVKLTVAESYNNSGKFNFELFKGNVKKIEGYEKIENEESATRITVTIDGIKIDVNNKGSVTQIIESTNDTKPYLPNSDFSQVSGTNLDTGLVIKDVNENSYVWVEVPKTIFNTATSNIDYTNIQKDMQTYALDYRETGYEDVYYNGCGLTKIEYNNLKNEMLTSVYDNGGFWISQYEIGTENIRKNNSDELTTPVSKEGVYVYNYIIVSQAQEVAQKMNSGTYNSSLLFGIQWDLTMKYMEVKGSRTQAQLKSDSTEWGNHINSKFDVSKGKYSTNYGSTYSDVTDVYTKEENTGILLTTGTADRNSVLNIYDLSGNVWEWTLENSLSPTGPAVSRGGSCYRAGSDFTANSGYHYTITHGDNLFGFRLSVY